MQYSSLAEPGTFHGSKLHKYDLARLCHEVFRIIGGSNSSASVDQYQRAITRDLWHYCGAEVVRLRFDKSEASKRDETTPEVKVKNGGHSEGRDPARERRNMQNDKPV